MLEQTRFLKRHQPILLIRELLNEVDAEIRVMANGQGAKSRRLLSTLLPGPWVWGGKAALSDLDVLHAHFGPNGAYAMPIARALDIPLVVTFHGYDATVRTSEIIRNGGAAGWRYIFRRRQLFSSAQAIIAVSKFIQQRLLSMGAPEQSLVQHYIGVDMDRFTPVPPTQRKREIICVGRLMDAKGIPDLISAFSKLPPRHADIKLVLIGTGPGKPVYQKLVGELNLADRVEFAGTMSHVEVANRVAQATVSVLFSKEGENGWTEAFGLASIEAQACGIPVIVSDSGGLPETVHDGVTGLVVPAGKAKALTLALNELLDDRSLSERMGQAGRLRVSREFSLETQTRRLESIYEFGKYE